MAETTSVLQNAVASAAVTREVLVEHGAIAALPGLLQRLALPGPRQIVADARTMGAAGYQLLALLRADDPTTPDPILLDEAPRAKPRADLSRRLAPRLKAQHALPLAVGSGVVNDITKYAAGLAGLPYVSVASAASMDGYAASGAAMLDGGFKKTLACPPPVLIIADLDIVSAAPRVMAAWGYGDLAGKLVAGADWVLADALGEEPIEPAPFGLVQDNVRQWLAAPEGVARGDSNSMRRLMNGLLISGFAMQAYGDSRPASGSEHQISHVWEMEGLAIDGAPAAHGACVGVAAVAMLALYQWFLAQDVSGRSIACAICPPPDQDALLLEAGAAFPDPALAKAALAQVQAKARKPEDRDRRLSALSTAWPALRSRLSQLLLPPEALEQQLMLCKAASHPGDLGISLRKLAADCRRARLIRRRYTLLDCLDELEWLDLAIAEIFAPRGYWGKREEPLESGAVGRLQAYTQ